jgi:hypothetical protein
VDGPRDLRRYASGDADASATETPSFPGVDRLGSNS